ncbi:hypothetical protein CBR_g61472 [Chara braunii]|uniref:Replication factor C C-terminal domain-containing protein n=1 Tax=Chara braunii TaxID=69332 RepID=A0A388K8S8_CHABU|nr:hypothetical protein CBR_g61472 [Chara braunii]|eukprot:GBG66429.1 hypothetical protein CBR_g61472 [Chara braunii]
MSSPDVTEEAVYLCTGNPMPKDIELICYWLLNESFLDAYQRILEMKTVKGLALVDIVRELQPWIFKIQMPAHIRILVVDSLADIEYRLAFGTHERIQMAALVGAFTHVRKELVAAAEG